MSLRSGGRAPRVWTDEERQTVRALWGQRIPLYEIQARVHASTATLRALAAEMGLGRRPTVTADLLPTSPPCIVVWSGDIRLSITAEERALLGTDTDEAVGDEINRPREWCARARAALGIPASHGRERRQRYEAGLRDEIAALRSQGWSVARISQELGQPLSTVKRVGANLSRAYRWDELEELLQVLGPLPMDELSRIWIPDAGRHVGGYVRDGYLRRGPAGLELTGKRPGRPGP